eukprot:CAMPEP_0177631500 /NCGR_PEP_ID=MMETSP0447-20121125/1784_1 /TAXON_ID=0 /ORGANISM="Stygamoeba regulata, Strain BSH-02190019" /LENGTH=705 /DNA_ID=CAMNT_0019132991 /DNA_START=193 /DNA_END=2310 /DNA_ORIENTATION=-
MKFGKKLQEQVVPEWAHAYVDYTLLKRLIKREIEPGRTASAARSRLAADDGPDPLTAAAEKWKKLLFAEIDKINSFFLAKEQELATLFTVKHQQEVNRLLRKGGAISEDDPALADFFAFVAVVDSLRKFTVLNYIGLLKIAKKHDKKSGLRLKADVAAALQRLPFYTSNSLALLSTEVQCLASQILWYTTGVAPSPHDFSCAVCTNLLNDPVVLSCTHKFCKSCLPKIGNICPVCRKLFDSFDPANYQVDSVLKRFVEHTFGAAEVERALPQRVMSDIELGLHSVEAKPKTSLEGGGGHGVVSGIKAHKQVGVGRRGVGLSELSLNIQFWRVGCAVLALWAVVCSLALVYVVASGQHAFASQLASGGYIDSASPSPTVSTESKRIVPILPTFENIVFVGHKKNDVDSICGAIAAAHLFHGTPARSDPINKETAFVLDRFGLPEPELSTSAKFSGANWGLVDHNQLDQVAAGVNLTRLLCLIDHHNLGANAVEVDSPRLVVIKPWGSTTSILTYMYMEYDIPIPVPVASCLLSGLISDTLNLRSPTTTENDRAAYSKLVAASGVTDLAALAAGMMQAKSNVDGMTGAQILLGDYKYFNMHGMRVGIGVYETVDALPVLGKKDAILEAMAKEKVEANLDFIFFFVVDVTQLSSLVLTDTPLSKQIVLDGLGGISRPDGLIDIGQRVSRKKTFVPGLSGALRKIAKTA